ncbi:PLD nuclease N-terminal domain-containing protein [Bowmanella denitrificans]|uniref:PLD nuclease N-terminal domain-containing protein n=1 Tax=Bowmanella denitrificans TaxID=366582 RepID=UPI003CD09B6E
MADTIFIISLALLIWLLPVIFVVRRQHSRQRKIVWSILLIALPIYGFLFYLFYSYILCPDKASSSRG